MSGEERLALLRRLNGGVLPQLQQSDIHRPSPPGAGSTSVTSSEPPTSAIQTSHVDASAIRWVEDTDIDEQPVMERSEAEAQANDIRVGLQHLELGSNMDVPVQQAALARGPLAAPIITGPSPVALNVDQPDLSLVPGHSSPLMGTPSPPGMRFCPLLAVAKFPYKFVAVEHRQTIASAFFDAEKIWNHPWELYYLWSEDRLSPQPIVFVAATQFQLLIDQINTTVPELKWAFKESDEIRGLRIDFPFDNDNLRPRYLGVSSTRPTYEALRDSVAHPIPRDSTTSAADSQLYAKLLDRAIAGGKNKTKDAASVKAEIGMRLQAAQEQLAYTRAQLEVLDGAEDVVFVAIDCEAYEGDRSHSRITEVGVATLDTRDLKDISPGRAGADWHKHIRTRHFLVQENRHLVNKRYILGCPDRFDFGQSEVISLRDLPRSLASCFREPYSGSAMDVEQDHAKRKVVLVGHEVRADIAYCQSLGFSLRNRSDIVRMVDTAHMARAISGDGNSQSLSSLVMQYDFDAWNPHNAGNDAVYTLWALLGLAMDERVTSPSTTE